MTLLLEIVAQVFVELAAGQLWRIQPDGRPPEAIVLPLLPPYDSWFPRFYRKTRPDPKKA